MGAVLSDEAVAEEPPDGVRGAGAGAGVGVGVGVVAGGGLVCE